VVDLETTALTPWDGPVIPGASQRLGTGETVRDYLERVGCTLDARPRARILTIIPLEEDGSNVQRPRVFDLDLFVGARPERDALLRGLHGKRWYGHNLAFDLMWVRYLVPDVAPAALVDTMLLATVFVPQLVAIVDSWSRGGSLHQAYPALGLADLSPEAKTYASSWVEKMRATARKADVGSGRIALEPLARLLAGAELKKNYQAPHNWVPRVLTRDHLAYCCGDVAHIPTIARRLLGLAPGVSEASLLDAMVEKAGAVAYANATAAALVLCDMQRRGQGFDRSAADDYRIKLLTAAHTAREKLLALAPELEAHVAPISDGSAPGRADEASQRKGGLTTVMKAAFAESLERAHGTPAPRNERTGEVRLGAKDLQRAYPGSPLVDAWATMQGALHAAHAADLYSSAAVLDGRVHALTTISAATLRTTSQAPNSQNAPRAREFRALFRARPGHKMVSSDFAAVELRVAAALGARACAELHALLQLLSDVGVGTKPVEALESVAVGWVFKDGFTPDLVRIDAILAAANRDADAQPPARRTAKPFGPQAGPQVYAQHLFDDLHRLVHALVRRMDKPLNAETSDPLPLREVFRRGLDPHLATAVALANHDTGGMSPLDYLASSPAAEVEALKHQLKHARQSAKAVNFGLAYKEGAAGLHAFGITSYGLAWSLDEAAAAREVWLDLYPEVELWQVFSETSKLRDKGAAQQREAADGTMKWVKDYVGATLSGRAICAPTIQASCAYQDQGTAAEIAHLALRKIPARTQAYLVGFLHDEFVLEVPADEVAAAVEDLEGAMRVAGNALLSPWGVPIDLETKIGDCWTH
jgi:DNA polymerase-1